MSNQLTTHQGKSARPLGSVSIMLVAAALLFAGSAHAQLPATEIQNAKDIGEKVADAEDQLETGEKLLKDKDGNPLPEKDLKEIVENAKKLENNLIVDPTFKNIVKRARLERKLSRLKAALQKAQQAKGAGDTKEERRLKRRIQDLEDELKKVPPYPTPAQAAGGGGGGGPVPGGLRSETTPGSLYKVKGNIKFGTGASIPSTKIMLTGVTSLPTETPEHLLGGGAGAWSGSDHFPPPYWAGTIGTDGSVALDVPQNYLSYTSGAKYNLSVGFTLGATYHFGRSTVGTEELGKALNLTVNDFSPRLTGLKEGINTRKLSEDFGATLGGPITGTFWHAPLGNTGTVLNWGTTDKMYDQFTKRFSPQITFSEWNLWRAIAPVRNLDPTMWPQTEAHSVPILRLKE